MSTPNCFLLSSHDDFSVVSMLPENVAVLTQVRDPVDRFLSAYEFAIEVAARSLKRPANYRKKLGRIATDDVWPWSYLIPFFAADMKPKVEAAQQVTEPSGGRWVEVEQDGDRFFYNKVLGKSKWTLTDEERAAGGGALPLLDPYDNDLVMSLKDFANHPIAADLLHNGATFQVLGITNYSHWGDADNFRICLRDHQELQEQMLRVAQARVRRFAHVGTTDMLFESAASALVSLHKSVDSSAYAGGDEDASTSAFRRRGADDDEYGSDSSGGGSDSGSEGEGGGRRRGGGGGMHGGAEMQLLAKLVREARQRLQDAQRNLVDAQREGADAVLMDELRRAVDDTRQGLIDAQDKLLAARDRLLPEQMGGGRRLMSLEGDGQLSEEQAQQLGEGDSGSGSKRQLLSAEGELRTGGGAEEEADAGAEGGQGQQEQQQDVDLARRRRMAGWGRRDDGGGEDRRQEPVIVDAFGNELDPNFKRIPNTNLGTEFIRCANRAQSRSNGRREQSLMALAKSDGRFVMFTKEARKRIPQEVIDLIKSHNKMDVALHALGLEMLAKRIEQQKEAGLYQPLPDLPKGDTGLGMRGGGQQQGARIPNRIPKPDDGGSGSDELR